MSTAETTAILAPPTESPSRDLPVPPGVPIERPRYIELCRSRAWSVYLTKGGKRWAVPFTCRSWRHEGECRKWRANENFRRLADPLSRCEPASVLLMVLTFRQRATSSGSKCLPTAVAMVGLGVALRRAAGLAIAPEHLAPDPRFLAFESLWRRWQSLRQAMHRESTRRGERRARWAMTVEIHRSGWPHANVLLEAPWLAQLLRDQRHDCIRRTLPAERCGVAGCIRDWLAEHAESCGFGPVVYIEPPARSRQELAGYILKLAGKVGEGVRRGVGEVVKFSQVPVNAPHHFRRLRSSRASDTAPGGAVERMLDPPFRDPELHGGLCNQPAHLVQAAIDADRDLVEQVDRETGEVTRIPFPLIPRPPPNPNWLEEGLVPIRLENERRKQAWKAFYAQLFPELA